MAKKKRGNFPVPFFLVTVLVLLIAGTLIAFLVSCVRTMPPFDPVVLAETNVTSTIYDANGSIFTRLHAEENRLPVSLEKTPKELQQAFISTEDIRFYRHFGVDPRAIARALWRIASRQSFEGGSTITQQLVKNAFLTQEQTWKRKVQEAILALQVERRYTKDQILEMYFNEIYFGRGAYGVQAASRTYFSKDVSELNLAEAAFIAGITKNPSLYSPFEAFDTAKSRQELVLDNMVRAGFISTETASAAKQQSLEIKSAQTDVQRPAPYFIDYVISTLVKELLPTYGSERGVYDAIYRGGLQIYTTLDPSMQTIAEKTLLESLPEGETDENGITQPQGALIALDPYTGYIKALVGGRDWVQTKFNRAVQAIRQPGSAFKPFVYATALAQGWSPASVLDDAPTTYNGKEWPSNHNHIFRGLTTLRTGIEGSINVMAVKLAEQVGPANIIATAEQMGITTLVKSGTHNDEQLALALGGMTDGVSPLEIAAAYGVLANGGSKVYPSPVISVKDSKGVVIWKHEPICERVLSPQVSFVMTDMLRGVITRGTGGSAGVIGRPAAGKTGTTTGNNDVWFVGYTPDLTAAVWIGSDAQKEGARTFLSRHNIGSSFPARIWGQFMQEALANSPIQSFTIPGGLVRTTVCNKSGLLPGNLCPVENLVTDYFIQGTQPTTTCDVHVTATVCTETGQLATEYCPAPEARVFIERKTPYASRTDGKKPLDIEEEMPVEFCTLHEAPVSSLVELYICPESGALATQYCPDPMLKQFILGTEPKGICPIHERHSPESDSNNYGHGDGEPNNESSSFGNINDQGNGEQSNHG
ncbi:MAG TPA: penicillin-binding protein 1A [bacterium]|jgi:penicillin-binding protein 1A|nr:penicillin-binding protein 1A [bacterium]